MIFVVILHSLICVLLVTVILMQSGRGGGLTESFAAAESVFGAKTNELMVKSTAVLAALFLVTSLSLAHFSAKKEQSLMDRVKNLPKIDLTQPPVKTDDKAALQAPLTNAVIPADVNAEAK